MTTAMVAAIFLFLQTGEKFASQETAGPIVSQLTSNLGVKLQVNFDPRVFNDPAAAVNFCARHKPVVGIVTPGFFLTYQKALVMEPLLETKRQKVEAERYVLVAKKDAGDLSGKTIATPLAAEQVYVMAVVLQNKFGDELRLQPTMDCEGAVFDLVEGGKKGADAVLMEEGIWKVISADPELGGKVKAVFTSDELPRNLVVLFKPNAGSLDVGNLKSALKGLGSDQPGKEILNMIRVETFQDIDESRLQRAQERYRGK